ncbi:MULTISPECIES: osmoprotectant ABC transporter substrate-binding protein [Enterococcus]|uniref:Glycine/betaine ABC transporter substrate-binding protein n=1 Tax=Enterococcus thailandicus TaxID=417368 RepID=A0A179ER16_ENTTH|nr:osmoprotectant ABC transporter substrate-binding protein [Enterococcus thailandicus]MDA3964619.1 osmoprotectant ABC transporter substrate-binding protein [Enterococcus thailandicus]MDT2751459.1 osmoprotectant ABC transporter substrate-binding protein [Enterococcus thailandicus]MDT2776414.1 osmoprotectant ABC transporter substrate-binding protein [Enterococcus thailandicus]MDT2794877.1 osmoprotectant ABC transporter substrate-binding protein [Enterococcus thailandicus]OAQ55686.1 glycine/beta
MKRLKQLILLFGLSLILGSCSLPGLASNTDDQTISITGGITSEAQILAGIVAGMVEHYTDKNTTIINNLATTTINHQAMINGDASISAARYTGTDLTTTLGLPPEKDPKKAFAIVKEEFEKRYNQTWFPSYGFENTYVFLVRKDTAEKYNLTKVSDLKNVADELVAGVDTSWINRKGDGYDGFQETYGFSFESILPMQIGLVYDAVEAGKMDIVLGYSTDGRIASYDLVMLEDDLSFFPPYDAAPVVANQVLKDTPHLEEALQKLGGTITTEEMQKLNYEADNNLVEPSVVAERFLKEHHYFEEGK